MDVTSSKHSKQELFAELVSKVNRCRLCPRMDGRQRVLSEKNGSLDSPVLFIAEGPGRLGADRYGIPLYGDQTGRNFDFFLRSIGWDRSLIFATNAVLCNPRDQAGNNAPPTSAEIGNCSRYLGELLEIISPKVIVPLGQAALQSLAHLAPHTIRLRYDVGKCILWNGYQVYPLYHPSPRAMIHRSKARQLADYYRLAELVRAKTGYWKLR